MDEASFDNFEQLWEVPEEAAADKRKPSEGPHTFTVKASQYFEDSGKWSLLLVDETGASIFKKCYLTDPSKASQNKQWMRAVLDSKPAGRLVDFNWTQCEGKKLTANVGSFTPPDKDEPITFVNKPEKAAAQVEKAVVKRTTDQKAKVAMSKEMASDVPF